MHALVKIYLEFRRNPAGIPARTGRTCLEFQVDSGWIPAEIRRNYCRHSPGIPPEFQTSPTGIPPELLPAFPRYSTGIPGWNSTGIIAGIPPVFHRNSGLEFRRNYCRHSPGIPPELLPAFPLVFHRNSTGIIAGIPPVFHRDSAEIIAIIPPAFHQNSRPEFCRNYCRHSPWYSTGNLGWNSTGIIASIPPGIPPEFWAEILPELLPTFSRYSG